MIRSAIAIATNRFCGLLPMMEVFGALVLEDKRIRFILNVECAQLLLIMPKWRAQLAG